MHERSRNFAEGHIMHNLCQGLMSDFLNILMFIGQAIGNVSHRGDISYSPRHVVPASDQEEE